MIKTSTRLKIRTFGGKPSLYITIENKQKKGENSFTAIVWYFSKRKFV